MRRRTFTKPAVVGAVAAVVAGTLAAGALAGNAAPAGPTWAAMGDSVSSGYGIASVDSTPSAWGEKQCARANGQAGDEAAMAVTANKLLGGPYEQYFVACSGALTDDWAIQLAEAYQKSGVQLASPIARGTPSRDNELVKELEGLAASGKKFDLISFHFTANNVALGFQGTLCADMLGPTGAEREWTDQNWGVCDIDKTQLDQLGTVISGKHAGALPSGVVPLWSPNPSAGNVEPLLSAIGKFVKPGGTVLVMGYPHFVAAPEKTVLAQRWKSADGLFEKAGNCDGLTPTAMTQFREIASVLNDGIKTATASANTAYQDRDVTFRFVDANTELGFDDTTDHGLCGPEPWINGPYTQPGPIHPNATGHAEAAKALSRVVKELPPAS